MRYGNKCLPFCTPKPDADLCMRVDLPLDKKTVDNQELVTGPLGRRAAGQPGRWAVEGRGPRVVGRWAFGPLGRGPAFSKTRFYYVNPTESES